MALHPRRETDFRIVSAPVAIRFECPICGMDVEIPWKEVDVPESWSDRWPDVECPFCEGEVQLDDWEYD